MPKRVAVVAWGFVIVGALALVAMVVRAMGGRGLVFDWSELLLPAGIALMQGHASSRRWAAFFLGIAVALFASFAAFALRPDVNDPNVILLGQRIPGAAPVAITMATLAVACGIAIWLLYSGPSSAFFDDDNSGTGAKPLGARSSGRK